MNSSESATRQILEALQQDSRQSSQALAEQVGLSVTPVWRRIKELEALQRLCKATATADSPCGSSLRPRRR